MIPNALAWKELPCWLTFSLCKSVCWLLNVNVFGFIFLYNFFWVFVSFKAATGRCLKYHFEIVVNLQYIPVLMIIITNSVNHGFTLASEAFVCVSLWLFSEALSSHISLHFLIITKTFCISCLHSISHSLSLLLRWINFFAVEQKYYSKRLIAWNGFLKMILGALE